MLKTSIWFMIFALFSAATALAAESITFPRSTIRVGGHKIKAEIATSEKQLAHGLMFRKKLAADAGMLFIFEDETIRHFWMKNTFIPLAIGFFDSKGILVDIQEMEPVKSEMQKEIPQYESRKPAKYVLEVPSGWFKKNGVKTGAKLQIPPGPLSGRPTTRGPEIYSIASVKML